MIIVAIDYLGNLKSEVSIRPSYDELSATIWGHASVLIVL